GVLSPWASIFVYAFLFATLMHPKLFFGKDSESIWFWKIPWKKQLLARTILFLLSVGIGAGGFFMPDFDVQFPISNFHSSISSPYLLMGFLHAIYNLIARRAPFLPVGMAAAFGSDADSSYFEFLRENLGRLDDLKTSFAKIL